MGRNQNQSQIRYETSDRMYLTAIGIVLLMVASGTLLQAQSYTVLHTFTGGPDGAQSYAGLTMDRAGHLYGTTVSGGAGYGVVFRLTRERSGWITSTLYTFQGGADGASPYAGVTIGPDGNLYGTTENGGSGCGQVGCGTVYQLAPPPRSCRSVNCPWTKTVLHQFNGRDGEHPEYGFLTFDRAGNIYGTTANGGSIGPGTVFELTPSQGGWTETILWNFSGGVDGNQPFNGVIFDDAGNLYGTTCFGGTNSVGNVWELSPSGSGWIQKTIYSFNDYQGFEAVSGVAMDARGNLYGDLRLDGPQGAGSIYQLSPSGSGWIYTSLLAPSGIAGGVDTPTLDAAGNVYVTSTWSGGLGSVFKLTQSNGTWNLSTLHAFQGPDGAVPVGGVMLDGAGNIYGTTANDGGDNHGVVFEITQE